MAPVLVPPWGSLVYPKLTTLWSTGDGCDLTIVCSDGFIKAPSHILCVLSEKLHEIILFSSDKILQFKNVNIKIWEDLLTILYTGNMPVNTNDKAELLNLYLVLSFAYYLGMDMVLQLYKLLVLNEPQKYSSSLWDTLCTDHTKDIEVEYSNVENGNATSYQTTFSSSDLSGLIAYVKRPKDILTENRLVEKIAKNKKKKVVEKCVNCTGKCMAKKVQCVLCKDVIQRSSGKGHMLRDHCFSASRVWAYSCTLSEKQDVCCLKGEIKLKNKDQSNISAKHADITNDVFWYNCNVCDCYLSDLSSYRQHFLSHGFFPNMCNSCCSVFAEEELLLEHSMYCDSQLVVAKTRDRKKSSGESTTEHVEQPLESHSPISLNMSESDFDEFEEISPNLAELPREIKIKQKKENDISLEIPIAKIKKEREEFNITEMKCTHCGEGCLCQALQVQCLYCYKICERTTPSDNSHMTTEHRHSTKAKLWPFTCDIQVDKQDESVLKRGSIEDNYECCLCGYYEDDHAVIIKHLNSIHNVQAVFCCRHCSCGFKHTSTRNEHQNFCGGGDYRQCNHCMLIFSSVLQLQKHKQDKHVWKEFKQEKDASSGLDDVTANIRVSRRLKGKKLSQQTMDANFIDPDLYEEKGEESNNEEVDGDDIRNEHDDIDDDQYVTRRKPLCLNCNHDQCDATNVKCIYCFRIVLNDIEHMHKYHPFTLKKSPWVYTCKYLYKKGSSDIDWVVCQKESGDDGEFVYRCCKCKNQFSGSDLLEKHMQSMHQLKPLVCKICHMGFPERKHRKEHEHFCAGGKSLKCKKCNVNVGTHKLLSEHNGRYHNSNNKRYILRDKSEENEANVSNLSEDEDNVEQATESDADVEMKCLDKITVIADTYPPIFQSDEDDFTAQTEGEEDEDYTIETLDEKLPESQENDGIAGKMVCMHCGTECKSEKVKCFLCYRIVKNDIQHMELKHPFTTRTSIWPVNCKFHSKSEEGLKEWVVCVKEMVRNKSGVGYVPGKFQYRCQLCKKFIFQSTRALQKHMRFKHNSYSIEFCKICEAGFKRKRYLVDHQYFCSGGRPLQCALCDNGKNLGGNKELEDHIRTVHFRVKKTDALSSKGGKNLKAVKHELVRKRPLEKWMRTEKNFKKRLDKRKAAATEEQSPSNLLDSALLSEMQVGGNGEGVRYTYCTAHCSTECQIEKVKCLYCFKVVGNNPDHMQKEHPCSPKDSPWLFSCRFMNKSVYSSKNWMLCRKEPTQNSTESDIGMADESNSEKFVYRCLKCENEVFETRPCMFKHMYEMHQLTPLLCAICECGFQSKKFKYAHEHYCSGGKMFKCAICDKELGGRKNLTDHLRAVHLGRAKKRKPEVFCAGASSIFSAKKRKFSTDTDGNELNESINDVESSYNDSTVIGDLADFDVLPSKRTDGYTKMCLICGSDCAANIIKCMYCNSILTDDKIDSHMKESHEFIPTNTVWPVSCKFIKYQYTMPNILAEATGERNDIEGERIQGDPLRTSKYRCTVCKEAFNNSLSAQNHVTDVHTQKISFCSECGAGMKKMCIGEHVYFCTGGEMLKCVECNKLIGGRQSAINHRNKIHPVNKKSKDKVNRAKTRSYQPKTVKNGAMTSVVKGNYGYNIFSADCMCESETCTQDYIKCSLCNDIVPKDDVHMKLKHPYSPCTTWIVYCRYSISMSTKLMKDTVGQKLPDAIDEDVLQNQLIPCTMPPKYICTICETECLDMFNLKAHLKTLHLEQGKRLFTCKYCDTMFVNLSSDTFSNHVHICSTGSLFACEFCDEVASTNKSLYYHINGSHPLEKLAKMSQYGANREDNMEVPEGQAVYCSVCDFITLNVSEMRTHCKTQHEFKTQKLNQVCRYCFRFYKTRSSREQHEVEEHVQGQKLVCETCGEEFNLPYKLKTHVYYYHKGGREKNSERKKLYAQSALMREETSVCPHCGNMYKSDVACRQHIKNIHEKKEFFSCRYCARTFRMKSTCRVHEDRHIGNKTFKCPHCPFRAYMGYTINKHAERNHIGVPSPYPMRNKYSGQGNTLLCEEDEADYTEDETDIANEKFRQVITPRVPVQQININTDNVDIMAVQNTTLKLEPLPQYSINENVTQITEIPGSSVISVKKEEDHQFDIGSVQQVQTVVNVSSGQNVMTIKGVDPTDMEKIQEIINAAAQQSTNVQVDNSSTSGTDSSHFLPVDSLGNTYFVIQKDS